MDLPEEEDKLFYSESVKSSQSIADSSNDLIKIIKENHQHFNEIVNQCIPVDNNLEKELAQEDKKCTFMQYKIENLKQRYLDAKEISTSLQKYVRDQQTEIKDVRNIISEQLEQLNTKFQFAGLSQYNDSISIIAEVAHHVNSFKNVLQHDIEEYDKNNVKVLQKKEFFLIRIDNIKKLIREINEQKEILAVWSHSNSDPDLNIFKKNLASLSKKFQEYQNIISKWKALKTELDELKKQEVEAFNEYQKINQISIELLTKCNHIMDIFRKECDNIKKEGMDIENQYYQTVKDWNTQLNFLQNQFQILEYGVNNEKQKIQTISSQRSVVEKENIIIQSQIEQLQLECMKIKTFVESCYDQHKISVCTEDRIQKQITDLESATLKEKFLLEQFTKDIHDLEQKQISSADKSYDLNVENLQETINLKQCEVQQKLTNNQKLSSKIKELQEVLNQRCDSNDKVKNELKFCQTESDFYEKMLRNSMNESNEIRDKQIAMTDQEIWNAMKDMNNAASFLFENQLLIDSVQNDIKQYKLLHEELQKKVWTANQKTVNSKNEVLRLQEYIMKENEIYENRKKLLEDLEKNSFPKNKIPLYWFKSFEKQKQEYDLLVKERLELEKERNMLILNIDSETFQENKNESTTTFDENSKSSFSNLKNTMYDLFKERVRKRKSTSVQP